MNIFSHFEARVARAAGALQDAGVLPAGADLSGISVEPPRDPSHGDLATNAALVLAKPAGLKPRDLAEAFKTGLEAGEGVASVEIAGPGFINLRLEDSFWTGIVRAILEEGENFARTDIGGGEKVNVEYVSANPTGPMHVGHSRSAVFGDALANLLAFTGHDVTREYYINDAGAQVDVLARSAFLRYREALGEDIGDIPEGLYPGDYLVPVGQALAKEHGDALRGADESEWLPVVRAKAIAMMMDVIRDDLAAVGIHHDVFFSERTLTEEADRVAETIAELEAQGYVYRGRLEPPKGKLPEDWEDREQLLFRATEFGDDIDRPLVKADGSYTYFAADMAYHRDKFARGFKQMIDVVGADHAGYVKRMQAAVKALTGGEGELDVKLCQLVKLFRGGEPVRMSKRAGTFVTLRDVVDEVGAPSMRFIMLFRKNDAPLDFDFVKVQEQSKDNPVFYVQYAHARAQSVFRNARADMPDLDISRAALLNADLTLLSEEMELTLIKRLSHFPRTVEAAAHAHEPHRIAFYLHEVASDFHALWNRGKESPQSRFILDSNKNVTIARLTLVSAVADVLRTGLGILGVEAVNEMR
ncbi:MAG: arginine--tRNA ligase [Dichotomicrobium sp.]